nr:CotH kinase family protein [Bacteroidota bacterium]
MKKTTTLLAFSLLFTLLVNSQSLPYEFNFSDDSLRLIIGGVETTGFYDESEVDTIFLEFSQPNYWSLLGSNFQSKTDLPATMIYKDEIYDSVGVRFKGSTSYNGTGNSQKKSFNITMDFIHAGQDVEGYETLNLNNCFDDPSFLREVLFYNLSRNHIPAAKANFTELYINGESWGIYANVQQLNKQHVAEWFLEDGATRWRCEKQSGGGGGGMFGAGYCSLNWLGADTSGYKPYYKMKKAYKPDPWDDLVHVCNVLNNSDDDILVDTLNTCMDVDAAIWYLVHENIYCDEDGYIYKGGMDYYVYFDVATNRMVPIEYDANSSFHMGFINSWTPFHKVTNDDYPLLHILLNNDELRQRYLAHYRAVLDRFFEQGMITEKIDAYAALIDERVQNDPKKLYSYNQFLNEIEDLKDFFQLRSNYVGNNTEVNRIGPAISPAEYHVDGELYALPDSSQTVDVTATVSHEEGIEHTYLYYGTRFMGQFEKTEMFDDGNHNDGAADDGIFGASIPPHQQGEYVRFYIEALAADNWATAAYEPIGAEHDVYLYRVKNTILEESDVVINELMADNTMTVADPNGEYEDWIELYNKTPETFDLTGWFMSDNADELNEWEFPEGTVIDGFGYLIVWCDEDLTQEGLHADFKLSSGGETVYLSSPQLMIAQQVTYDAHESDESFSRVPNGTGDFVWQNPTFNGPNTSVTVNESPHINASFSFYPSPVSEWLTLEINDGLPHEISIYTLLGNPVFSETIKNSTKINVGDWPKGLYIIGDGKGPMKKISVF